MLSMEIWICQLQLKSVHAACFERADLGMSTSATAKAERAHTDKHMQYEIHSESKGLGGIDDREVII